MSVRKFLVPLVVLLTVAGCQGSPVPRLFDRAAPHETYEQQLKQAGLADTALARDWIGAAERALSAPQASSLPLTNQVTHAPSAPAAYGYRLKLQRGRVLKVTLSLTSSEPSLIFIDLFAPGEAGQAPRHVASAERGTTTLEHEIESHYYAHLERQAVTTGEHVTAGDVVGYVGNTGNARTTPPHLHFGIYRRGEGPIDPLPFVQGRRGPAITSN